MWFLAAQTEGDTGYDYQDAYDDDFDDGASMYYLLISF